MMSPNYNKGSSMKKSSWKSIIRHNRIDNQMSQNMFCVTTFFQFISGSLKVLIYIYIYIYIFLTVRFRRRMAIPN